VARGKSIFRSGTDETLREKGNLFIVSTPIGNLEDITLRALRVLGEVDLIAAEDTRRTARLLSTYEIRSKIISFHDHNKEGRTPGLLDSLRTGVNVAIVSDAGTPGISDPCYYLVSRAVAEGIDIIPIPGPTAAISALVVSGLPTDRFVFEGFLPAKEGRCRARLRELAQEKRTIVFYESPHRLERNLKMMSEILGDRRVALARELTKRFEEIQRGPISLLIERWKNNRPRGEFVIVIEGAEVTSKK
jgi:16S rRNA (cytidine1402-2'-O)-methyltransferase